MTTYAQHAQHTNEEFQEAGEKTEFEKLMDRDLKFKVEYTPFQGTDTVVLSPQIVMRYFCKPTKKGFVCSEEHATRFIMLCKARGLDPREGDAFIVGYDTQDGPEFNIITAHQAFMKRAEAHIKYDGMESGVIVKHRETEEIKDLEGDFFDTGECDLVGGWARVHRSDRKYSTLRRLDLRNFDKDRSVWNSNKSGMIVKCAEADALRSSFPNSLAGMYNREEMPPPEAAQEAANTRLAAILPAIADAPPAAMPPAPPAKEAAPADNPAKKSSARPKAQPAEKAAPTPEPPAPEPEPLPPEPAAPEPEAPGEVSKFLCYKTMPPEDVAPVDWLGFADAPSLAEFYRKMDVGLRTTHWNCLTDDVRAIVAAACKPKTAAKPEPKPMVPESPATVIPAHAAAEGSQVDEYQEFVDSKSFSQLKVWFTRVTPDLLTTGREAAGVTNLSECNESQARKAAYAMRKAQGKK